MRVLAPFIKIVANSAQRVVDFRQAYRFFEDIFSSLAGGAHDLARVRFIVDFGVAEGIGAPARADGEDLIRKLLGEAFAHGGKRRGRRHARYICPVDKGILRQAGRGKSAQQKIQADDCRRIKPKTFLPLHTAPPPRARAFRQYVQE